LILALYWRPAGVETTDGNRVVYDLNRNEAFFGAGATEAPALVWELALRVAGGARLAAPVELDPDTQWLMRCDRVDFPPGGVAYRHTHPGPGIRCLLCGSIRITSGEQTHVYGPLEPWFEPGPEPVMAAASDIEETAFVRVMLLPQEWDGRRTIRYVDPADEAKPKQQRVTVFFDRPISP
jgi:quercetin dioxygenase-like cupin family protein